MTSRSSGGEGQKCKKLRDVIFGRPLQLLLCADVGTIIAEDEEERVQNFRQMIDELCVRHLIHGLDPAKVESPGERVLAVHLVLQDGDKCVQYEFVTLGDNVLHRNSNINFINNRKVRRETLK